MFCLKLYITLFCTTAEYVSKASFFFYLHYYTMKSQTYIQFFVIIRILLVVFWKHKVLKEEVLVLCVLASKFDYTVSTQFQYLTLNIIKVISEAKTFLFCTDLKKKINYGYRKWILFLLSFMIKRYFRCFTSVKLFLTDILQAVATRQKIPYCDP